MIHPNNTNIVACLSHLLDNIQASTHLSHLPHIPTISNIHGIASHAILFWHIFNKLMIINYSVIHYLHVLCEASRHEHRDCDPSVMSNG